MRTSNARRDANWNRARWNERGGVWWSYIYILYIYRSYICIIFWSDLGGKSWVMAWVGSLGFRGFGAGGGRGLSPCSAAS